MLHLESGLVLPPEQSIALALDTSDIEEANRLTAIAQQAGGALVKEGLELLYAGVSPQEMSEIAGDNMMGWVADFKTKATPKTMASIQNLVNLAHPPVGITVSTDSGVDGLRLAQEIANEKGIMIFGVGYLSTRGETEAQKHYHKTSQEIMRTEAALGFEAGITGFVSSGEDLPLFKLQFLKKYFTLVVGTRSGQTVIEGDDQRRVTTQYEAAQMGAGLIEVGREATQSSEPKQVLENIAWQIEVGRRAGSTRL